MIEHALSLGFIKDHIGCPCNGSPQVMVMDKDGTQYVLTIWQKRDVWRLASHGYTFGSGKGAELDTKLHEYGIL